MQTVRKVATLVLLVILLFASVMPVSASSRSGTTREVIKEEVTWRLDPGLCKQINSFIDGTGQRRQVVETRVNKDGSTREVIDDLVSGTAVDGNGATYQFLYVNHSTWVTPASGTPVSIKMNDLFILKGNRSKVNNLRVAFDWKWTYDPLTSEYWPPVDNLKKNFTVGDPINCDPI